MEWNVASWAQLAGKAEYQTYRKAYGTTSGLMYGLTFDVITEALASAAEDSGLIPDFELPAFYRTHVAKLLCTDDPDVHPGFRELTYDAFAAVVLMEHINRLLAAGLLAQAEEGHDYHLALPGVAAFRTQEAADDERVASAWATLTPCARSRL